MLARVRGIENDIYKTNKYILYKIYLFNEKNKNRRVITVKTTLREIYLVNGLVVDMLLRNDILILEEIDLLFSKKTAHIDSCDVNIPIEVQFKESLIRRVINLKEITVISSHSNATVIIYYLDLSNRDFLFESREDSILFLYAKIINKNIEAILVKNNSNKLVKIQRNMKLGDLSDLIIDSCYHVISGQENITKLATRYLKTEHYQIFAKGLFKKLVFAGKIIAIVLLVTQATAMHVINNLTPTVNVSTIASAIEITTTSQDTVLFNKVTIYNNVPKLV